MDSLRVGRKVYEANCLICHGPEGRGDGVIAMNFDPKPADLATHAGMHSDFYFFWWISNGIEGTVMPSFESTLSEEERWHLVNYIKTFAPKRR